MRLGDSIPYLLYHNSLQIKGQDPGVGIGVKRDCSLHVWAKTTLQLSLENETRSNETQISTACVICTKLLLLRTNLEVRSRDCVLWTAVIVTSLALLAWQSPA